MKKMMMSLLCGLLMLSVVACSNNTTQSKDPVTMTAGDYSATVKAMKGDMTVTVTVDEASILDIQLDTVDTANVVGAVEKQMIPEILENQTLNVDSVAGATVSSAAVKSGIKKCLEEAGADLSTSFNTDATVKAELKDAEEAAVVVVGSGAAGLSTAIMLKENGVDNIIVVEKLGYFGGTTSHSGGGVWAVGKTEFNENTGFDYDADGLVKHLYDASGAEAGSLNEALIKNIANVSKEVFEYYLNEAEVPFDIESLSFGDSLNEMPVAWTDGSGIVLIDKMVEQAEALGIDLRLNSRVTSLLSEDGAVCGVHVESREAIYDIHADKVVLATGGFQRNQELVNEITPDFANEVPFTSAGSTGDGIIMAKELGAYTNGYSLGGMGGLGQQFGYQGYGSYIWAPAIYVNKEGVRFFNERQHYSYHLEAIMKQTDGKVYGIGDSSSYAFEDIDLLVEMGYAFKADTIEKLAELMGVDASALKNTVDTYNAEKQTGADDSAFGVANASMGSLTEAPYYALKIDGVSFASLAGLVADEKCHIVKEDGTVIENLYGAGELISGNILQGRYAGSGSQVGAALYEGKIIADDIASAMAE